MKKYKKMNELQVIDNIFDLLNNVIENEKEILKLRYSKLSEKDINSINRKIAVIHKIKSNLHHIENSLQEMKEEGNEK